MGTKIYTQLKRKKELYWVKVKVGAYAILALAGGVHLSVEACGSGNPI